MTPLPATLLPASLGRGWIGLPDPHRATVRSHFHDGRCVHVIGKAGWSVAVDAESLGGPAAHELAVRHELEIDEFLMRWTRAEVAAKLLGLPSLLAFREGVERVASIAIRTAILEDVVLSVGWLPRREEGPVLPSSDDAQEALSKDAVTMHRVVVREKHRPTVVRVRPAQGIENGAERLLSEGVEEIDEQWVAGKRKSGGIHLVNLAGNPTGDEVPPCHAGEHRIELDPDDPPKAGFRRQDERLALATPEVDERQGARLGAKKRELPVQTIGLGRPVLSRVAVERLSRRRKIPAGVDAVSQLEPALAQGEDGAARRFSSVPHDESNRPDETATRNRTSQAHHRISRRSQRAPSRRPA